MTLNLTQRIFKHNSRCYTLIMTFVTTSTSTGARFGTLDQLGDVKNIQTPMCMLYTKGGSVPYLTKDMLQSIARLPQIVHMPLAPLIAHVDAVEKYGKGIKEFTAMQDLAVFCSLHDPAEESRTGFNGEGYIGMFGIAGKFKVDEAVWLRTATAFRPDAIQVLTDSDTPPGCSQRRRLAALKRSRSMLTSCLAQSEHLSGVHVFPTIQGAHDVMDRTEFTKDAVKNQSLGFILEGFHNYGPETEKVDIKDFKHIITAVTELVPASSLRMLPGIMCPGNVLHAVDAGIDIFDSSYAYVATERRAALVFRYDADADSRCQKGMEINLRDKEYSEDFSPLLAGCGCYTCKQHTRAYVSHLLSTDELLGRTLLMLHNLHHYFRFFEALRKSLHENSYDNFAKLIRNQIQ